MWFKVNSSYAEVKWPVRKTDRELEQPANVMLLFTTSIYNLEPCVFRKGILSRPNLFLSELNCLVCMLFQAHISLQPPLNLWFVWSMLAL